MRHQARVNGRFGFSGILLVAALVAGLGRDGSAQDLLLLRDGTERRGPLAECSADRCRLGADTVARAAIEWIGLGRPAVPPPPVGDPARDEVHLLDRAVHTGRLIAIDGAAVHLAAGEAPPSSRSFRRARVAWIHLGLKAQADVGPAPEARAGPGAGPDDRLNPFFDAAAQAVEEAILNALVAAESMEGRDGRLVPALPHDAVRRLLTPEGRP